MEVIDGKVVLSDDEKDRCKDDWWFHMQVAFRQISEDCAHRRPFMRIVARNYDTEKSCVLDYVASWPIARNTFDILFGGRNTLLCLDKNVFTKQVMEGRKKRQAIVHDIKEKIALIDQMTEDKYKIYEVIREDLKRLINTE